jgi:hypothetical protein
MFLQFFFFLRLVHASGLHDLNVVDCCSIVATKTTEASDSMGAFHSSSRHLGIVDTKDKTEQHIQI